MSDDPRLTSDVSDFDFDRSAQESWRRFGERLAEVLSVMDAGATLAIGSLAEAGEGAPHVRFHCADGGALTAHATTAGLGDEAGAALAASGWTPAPKEAGTWTRRGTQEEAEELAMAASDALRDVHGVQHPALLAPDQLADILTPTPVEQSPTRQPAFNADSLIAIVPQNRQHLYQLIDAELTQLLGHQPVRDDDGDFALRVGSTMVFIRVSPDAEEVIVFSAIVHDLDGRTRAMEALSDLNTDARYVRFILIRDRVFVSLSIFAHPFVPAHLNQALGVVSVISDSIDNELARKLRGRTTFDDDGAPEA